MQQKVIRRLFNLFTDYWYLKWKQTRRGNASQLSDRQLRLFLFFKRANLFLLLVGFLVFMYQLFVFPKDYYWFLFLYIFALIEHINYYHVRLSYMSPAEIKEFIRQKGFRRSKLARELEERFNIR